MRLDFFIPELGVIMFVGSNFFLDFNATNLYVLVAGAVSARQ